MNEKKQSPFFVVLALSLLLTPVVFLPVLHSFILPRQTFVVMAIIVLLAIAAVGVRRRLRSAAYTLPWILFAALSFISIFHGPSFLTGFKTFFYFFFLSTLAVVISLIPNLRKYFPTILAAIVVPGIFNSIYAIVQLSGADFAFMKTRFDVMGSLGSPGFLGGYLSLCAVICFHCFVHSKHTHTAIVYIFLTLLFSIVSVLTLSRTSLISLGAGSFVYAFLTVFQWRLNKKWSALCMAGIFVVAGVSSFILLPSTGVYNNLVNSDKPLSSYFSSRYKSNSVLQRRLIWKSAVEIIKEHPISGTGAGSFYYEYPLAQAKILEGRDISGAYSRIATDRIATYAHNDYLQIASEMGLPGLAAFLLFIFFAIVCLSRSVSVRNPFVLEYFPILVAVPTTILVQSLFDFPLYMPASALIFWVFIGFCATKYPSPPDEVSPNYSGLKRAAIFSAAAILIVLASLPLTAIYLLARADQKLATGDYSASERLLSMAETYDPSEPAIPVELARLERLRRNFRESVACYDRSLKISNHPEYFYGKGMSAYLAGDIPEAKKAFLSVLKIDHRSSDALSRLGIIWLQTGEISKAVSAFKQAIEIDPSNIIAKKYLLEISSHGGALNDSK